MIYKKSSLLVGNVPRGTILRHMSFTQIGKTHCFIVIVIRLGGTPNNPVVIIVKHNIELIALAPNVVTENANLKFSEKTHLKKKANVSRMMLMSTCCKMSHLIQANGQKKKSMTAQKRL